MWRVSDQAFDWFNLIDEQYIVIEPDSDGIMRSKIFSGLWLETPALLTGNLAQVLKTVQQGILSHAHQVFVQKL